MSSPVSMPMLSIPGYLYRLTGNPGNFLQNSEPRALSSRWANPKPVLLPGSHIPLTRKIPAPGSIPLLYNASPILRNRCTAVGVAEAGELIRDAIARYATEVREGRFPDAAHSFDMRDEVLKRVYGG